MKRSYGFVLALLLVAVPSFADSKFEDNDPPGLSIASICDTVALKEDGRMTITGAVPDNNPVGLTTPPMAIANDGTTFINVVLSMKLSLTWIGDLVAQLQYFEDCASASPSAVCNVICRPGGTVCGPGGGVGCSSNFIAANELRFNDLAAASLPTAGCATATNVAAGCYKPTGTGVGSLGAFAGLHKGGCFKLFLQDNAVGDLCTLSEWAVFSLNQNPVPAVPATWGGVKNIYR